LSMESGIIWAFEDFEFYDIFHVFGH